MFGKRTFQLWSVFLPLGHIQVQGNWTEWGKIRHRERFYWATQRLSELRISSPFVVQAGLWNSRSKLHSQHRMEHHLHICEIHNHKEDYESPPAFINVELWPETKVRWRTEMGPLFTSKHSKPNVWVFTTSLILFLLWVLVICFLLFIQVNSQFISWAIIRR